MATTEQVGGQKPHPNGSLPNPTGKGGFADHPENRNPGGWNKEMVFSYQYRRFMNMTMDELNDFRAKPDMERKVVEELAYRAVMRAKESLRDVQEITDRTEGKAPQYIGLGDPADAKKALVEFIGLDTPENA